MSTGQAFDGKEDEPGIGRLRKEVRPHTGDRVIDFGAGIEATESEYAGLIGGERADGRRLGRLEVAPERMREANRLFGIERLERVAGRIEVWVGETVIHRLQARAAGVGEVGYLNRRGLAGEGEKPVTGDVHHHIDENVDA